VLTFWDRTSVDVRITWSIDPPELLANAEWEIRVRGDPTVALRDFDPWPANTGAVSYPTRYWAGTFAAPVTTIDE
jgi:hypothetical protein